jgi:hypothetical protein
MCNPAATKLLQFASPQTPCSQWNDDIPAANLPPDSAIPCSRLETAFPARGTSNMKL